MSANQASSDTPVLSFVQQQHLLEEALRSSDDVENALDECRRELKVRERVYKNWVENGTLTRLQATQQFKGLQMAITMLIILCDLRKAMPGFQPTVQEEDSIPF